MNGLYRKGVIHKIRHQKGDCSERRFRKLFFYNLSIELKIKTIENVFTQERVKPKISKNNDFVFEKILIERK